LVFKSVLHLSTLFVGFLPFTRGSHQIDEVEGKELPIIISDTGTDPLQVSAMRCGDPPRLIVNRESSYSKIRAFCMVPFVICGSAVPSDCFHAQRWIGESHCLARGPISKVLGRAASGVATE
jgi:hypothetical protein